MKQGESASRSDVAARLQRAVAKIWSGTNQFPECLEGHAECMEIVSELHSAFSELQQRPIYPGLWDDAKLGQQCESLIALKTHFTGEPPYVGNAGVLLALRESLDELNRLRSERGSIIEECRQTIKEMYQTSARTRDMIEVTRILDALRALKSNERNGT